MTEISSSFLLTDDTGDGVSGTKINRAWTTGLRSAINALVHSTTNPTTTPVNAIDWLEDLKGNKSTPNERLSVFIDDDGNPRTLDGVPQTDDVKSILGNKNLWWDSLFSCWPDGSTSAPAGWTLTGTGAAVVRCGAGPASYESSPPADTTKFTYGNFCVKLTYGSATAKLTRTLIPTGYMPSGLKGRTFTFIVKAKASNAANASSMTVTDGVQTIRAGTAGNGTYVSTTSEGWIYCTITLDASATKLEMVLEQALSGHCYFGVGCILLGNYVPNDYIPEKVGRLIISPGGQRGTATVANTINEFRHVSTVYGVLRGVALVCKTAPTGQSIKVRTNKGGYAQYVTTFPQILAGATQASMLTPNGVYADRCIKPDSVLSWDITQVGSGTAGEEVSLNATYFAFINEFEALTEL